MIGFLAAQMDADGAESGQYYESFNERVIAGSACRPACGTAPAAKPLPTLPFGAIMTAT
jgi:hypothetical protein